uniref:PHD-type domain-containing protein n=1 Tax=Arcella intermedia TaxID=1963864 RepID=A0A6B2L0Q8_9EUKA
MKVQTEQGNGQSFETNEANEGEETQAQNSTREAEEDNTKNEEMEIVQKSTDNAEKEKEKENEGKKTEDDHIQENEHSSEDPNDDFCKFCNATGDLLCCEKCPTSWHLYCLQPPLKDFPEGDWSCPLCEKKELGPPITLSKVELRITRELHRPNRQRRKSTEAQTEERFAVPPGPWWDCITLISTLKKHKSAWPFLDPVDPVRLKILEYYQVVPRPMDLGTVEKKLRDEKYRNMHQFANDVRLIWSNAETFNGPEHNVTKLAYEVREVFEKLFQEKLRYWRDYIEKMPLTRRRKKPTFVPKEPPKKPLKSEGSCSTDTGEDEVPAKNVRRESSSKLTKQKSKVSTSATPNSKKSNSTTKAKNTPAKPPITKQRSTTQPQPTIMTYNIPNPTTYPRTHMPNPTSPPKGTTLPPISPHLNNPAHAGVPVSPMYPKNFATRTLPTSPHSRSGSMVNGNYDVTGDVRMGVPVQYMRVHYEKKIVKADSTSLDSLKMRLKNCFDIQCNIRLYYLDEDKTRINVFDENCFNIFLQSKIPKDLFMEKE